MTDTDKLDLILLKINDFVTKEDLKIFATKEDLKALATKEDLKTFATKEELKYEFSLVVKKLNSMEERINRKFETINENIQKLCNSMESLRYSNEAVAILIKRQDLMEIRLQEVERKVSCL